MGLEPKCRQVELRPLTVRIFSQKSWGKRECGCAKHGEP